MGRVAHGIDRLEAVFDDACLVADAGLLLAATVMGRLGLEALINEAVRPPGAGRGSGPKVLSLVASMLVGGRCIDDTDRLRAGSAGAVLGFEPVAPSTVGSFLRSFTFGHVRQLDRASELALGRAWSAGAAPRVAEMTIDLDSTVCEVCGRAKQAAAYGHTKVLCYHPLVAVRADTGEVLHSRMREGSSQRGHQRFAAETAGRARRAAGRADMKVTVRADSGFFSYDMLDTLDKHKASWSITVAQNPKVKAAAEAIAEPDWQPIAYTRGGEAQVAETTIVSGRRDNGEPREMRMVARRTRLVGSQRELWPNWRYHCLVTNRDDLDTKAADAYHRNPATVELAIRDLKEGSGLSRCPSGKFSANGAWLACAALAHNLTRWTARLGHVQRPDRLTVAATVRNRLLTVPGRLVNRSRRQMLRLPAHWPWAHTFTTALQHLRNLPLLI